MVSGVPAGQKAAHAVAVQHHRQPRIPLVQGGVHGFQIGEQAAVPVFVGKVAVLLGGSAGTVAQMIVARHHKTAGGEKLNQIAVAADVLAHAVADLENCPGFKAGHRVNIPCDGVLFVR